jgi:hypothetical protein
MAERRMFAKAIINSGKFLRMPPTSRLLYYDLGMAADDDGVVEAYSVMTQTKATEDDLRVLVAKGYIRILNDDLVSVICDWQTNNTIRSDRYHPSIYAELIQQPTDNQLTTTWQPTDNQMETEVRLGKDRLDKVSIYYGDAKPSPAPQSIEKPVEKSRKFVKPTVEQVRAYCQERQNGVNPEKFVDYYDSNGWKVGKNAMKDWKAAVRTWEKNGYSNASKPEQAKSDIDKYKCVINKF